MDRIEKFLNRRPVKNKRRIKCNGKEYTITKEDLKTVRNFRKNICMDQDVDLYRPLNLKFSRKTMSEGLPVRKKKDVSLEVQEKLVKRYKNIGKRKEISSKNEIVDLWEDEGLDDLDKYEQDMFMKIGEAYSGAVEELRYSKEDLAKSIRREYLRVYEPREKKLYRLKELIKEMPRPETLKPFPEEVGMYFEFDEPIKVGISKDFRKFAVASGGLLSIYEFKNFLKMKTVTFDDEVAKIMFTRDDSICVLLRDRICVVDDMYNGTSSCNLGSFYHQEFPTWSRSNENASCTVIGVNGKISNMQVHHNAKYIGIVCGKTILLCDLESRSMLKVVTTKNVVPLKIEFHRVLSRMLVSTSNSLMIYDIVEKKTVCETKDFSFILDFMSITDNVVLITNNLNRIILFDHSRNMILRSMAQDNVVAEVMQHRRYNLMCAVSSNELFIFHNNLADNLIVPLKRIPGKYRCIAFHPELPWLYAVKGRRLLVFT